MWKQIKFGDAGDKMAHAAESERHESVSLRADGSLKMDRCCLQPF